jgi:NAD(P)-dependent dehydrogenase (short-subunit alcohol dehydrogenase family)
MAHGSEAPDFPTRGCAIVFGATGGLGRASAGLIAERGSDVVLTYRSREAEAEALAEEIRGLGRRATVVHCDVAVPASVQQVADTAKSEHGGVHTVISAGGLVFHTAPMIEFSDEIFRGVIDTDVIGFFNIAKATVPLLRHNGGGSIVALITCAVSRTVPTDALSAVPKAAVSMMVRHLATEEAANGIRANAVGPGVIDGGMVIPMRDDPATAALLDLAVDFTPLGRLGSESEIAEVVAFLASSKASYITGQLLMADGGLAA